MTLVTIEKCCDIHQPNCCDPEDCGPCCPGCPTCPTLNRLRAAADENGIIPLSEGDVRVRLHQIRFEVWMDGVVDKHAALVLSPEKEGSGELVIADTIENLVAWGATLMQRLLETQDKIRRDNARRTT